MNKSIYTNNALNQKTAFFITAVFFLVALIGVYYHEIWMDESHHFLLGRDSSSFLDLFQNTRYDGHPILWNYLIHLTTLISDNPFYMQFLHIVISTITVYIFVKKTPFSLWFKITFLLSYFMLYEYTVISRNYSLGILFLFAACSYYQKREQSFTVLCLFLALCCNTHSIFIIISAGLLFSILTDQISQHKFNFIKKYWKGYLIFIIGCVLAYFQIVPKSDTPFFDTMDYTNVYELSKSGISMFKALFPIVDFTQEHYWNRFYLIEHFRNPSLIIAVLLWFIPLILFNKRRNILIFVYSTCLGFILFTFLIQRYGARYNGILFLSIIIGLWMMYFQEPKNFQFRKLKLFIITGLMIIQAGSGILVYSLDLSKTFNHGKNVANYITGNNISSNRIVTFCESASINAYLKENLYHLCYKKSQGFYEWKNDCSQLNNKTDKELVENAFVQKRNAESLIFILSKPIEREDQKQLADLGYSILSLKKFEAAVTHNYYIYEIKHYESQ